VLAEAEQPLAERLEEVEVVSSKRFALHDREVELDLVEPLDSQSRDRRPSSRLTQPLPVMSPSVATGPRLDGLLIRRP
jgi:hypothetical protein